MRTTDFLNTLSKASRHENAMAVVISSGFSENVALTETSYQKFDHFEIGKGLNLLNGNNVNRAN